MPMNTRRAQTCVWCGREVDGGTLGRRRRYCRQSCRQRAYEHRNALKGSSISEDSVVLSADEAAAVVERAFEVRCAAEDVATAFAESADAEEVAALCADLVRRAKDAERLR